MENTYAACRAEAHIAFTGGTADIKVTKSQACKPCTMKPLQLLAFDALYMPFAYHEKSPPKSQGQPLLSLLRYNVTQ